MTDQELEALVDAAEVRTIPVPLLPMDTQHVHAFRKTGLWWSCRVPGCNLRKIH